MMRRVVDATRTTGTALSRIQRQSVALVAAILVLVGVSGSSLAARPTLESQIRVLTGQVLSDASKEAVCRPSPQPSFVEASGAEPAPHVAALLARIGGDPAASRVGAAQHVARGGTVLAKTLRSVVFPGHNELLVFAWTGVGGLMPRNPSACEQARLDRLASLHPAIDAVRSGSAAIISQADDTDTGIQRIAVARFQAGVEQGNGGIRIVHDQPATGIFGSQSGPSRASRS